MLTLLTLPVIIIASRAAIQAVPPSIREAALGLGASKTQVVFHHVLPLAMPGMLTGAIIGMSRALGESAPLLMIGMVADGVIRRIAQHNQPMVPSHRKWNFEYTPGGGLEEGKSIEG